MSDEDLLWNTQRHSTFGDSPGPTAHRLIPTAAANFTQSLSASPAPAPYSTMTRNHHASCSIERPYHSQQSPAILETNMSSGTTGGGGPSASSVPHQAHHASTNASYADVPKESCPPFLTLPLLRSSTTGQVHAHPPLPRYRTMQAVFDPAGTPRTPDAVGVTELYGPFPHFALRSSVGCLPRTKAQWDILMRHSVPFGLSLQPMQPDAPVPEIPYVLRCELCRTYISCYSRLLEGSGTNSQFAHGAWMCHLCGTTNAFPESYCNHDWNRNPEASTEATSYPPPGSVLRGQDLRHQRPELKYMCADFAATDDYGTRPPQPPCILFVLDVSMAAVTSGLCSTAIATLRSWAQEYAASTSASAADPGLRGREQRFGLVTLDRSIHLYTVRPSLQVHTVTDVLDEDVPIIDGVMLEPRVLPVRIGAMMTSIRRDSGESFLKILDVVEDSIQQTLDGISSCSASSLEANFSGALNVILQLMLGTGGKAVFLIHPPMSFSSSLSALDGDHPSSNASEPVAFQPDLSVDANYFAQRGMLCSFQYLRVDVFAWCDSMPCDTAAAAAATTTTTIQTHEASPTTTWGKQRAFAESHSLRAIQDVLRGCGGRLFVHHHTPHAAHSPDVPGPARPGDTTSTRAFQEQLHAYLDWEVSGYTGARFPAGNAAAYEAILRVRCSRGCKVRMIYASCHVKNYDLIALPVADAASTALILLEPSGSTPSKETKAAYIQVTVMYTTHKGRRRLRVFNLSIPYVSSEDVSAGVAEVLHGLDAGVTFLSWARPLAEETMYTLRSQFSAEILKTAAKGRAPSPSSSSRRFNFQLAHLNAVAHKMAHAKTSSTPDLAQAMRHVVRSLKSILLLYRTHVLSVGTHLSVLPDPCLVLPRSIRFLPLYVWALLRSTLFVPHHPEHFQTASYLAISPIANILLWVAPILHCVWSTAKLCQSQSPQAGPPSHGDPSGVGLPGIIPALARSLLADPRVSPHPVHYPNGSIFLVDRGVYLVCLVGHEVPVDVMCDLLGLSDEDRMGACGQIAQGVPLEGRRSLGTYQTSLRRIWEAHSAKVGVHIHEGIETSREYILYHCGVNVEQGTFQYPRGTRPMQYTLDDTIVTWRLPSGAEPPVLDVYAALEPFLTEDVSVGQRTAGWNLVKDTLGFEDYASFLHYLKMETVPKK